MPAATSSPPEAWFVTTGASRPSAAGAREYAAAITSCTPGPRCPTSADVSGPVSEEAGPRPSRSATAATSPSRTSQTAEPVSPSSQPAPSACRATRCSTTAAAPAPVPATSTLPVGAALPAANAVSRSVTTTGSPGSSSRCHAATAWRRTSSAPAAPAPATPRTPPTTDDRSSDPSAEVTEEASRSTGSPPLERWLSPAASPEPSGSPVVAATRQRVDVPPASTRSPAPRRTP